MCASLCFHFYFIYIYIWRNIFLYQHAYFEFCVSISNNNNWLNLFRFSSLFIFTPLPFCTCRYVQSVRTSLWLVRPPVPAPPPAPPTPPHPRFFYLSISLFIYIYIFFKWSFCVFLRNNNFRLFTSYFIIFYKLDRVMSVSNAPAAKIRKQDRQIIDSLFFFICCDFFQLPFCVFSFLMFTSRNIRWRTALIIFFESVPPTNN